MPKHHSILMGDIIKSSRASPRQLMREFKKVITAVNRNSANLLLFPLTITLGDEFQSVPRDRVSALQLVFHIEEMIIRHQFDFKLRYVIADGAIETPINTEVAHGMLGPGLTAARERLNAAKKPGSPRFSFDLPDKDLGRELQNTFVALQAIMEGWRVDKDYDIVHRFIRDRDYKVVARKLGKDPSLLYKRGRSLMTDSYHALKSVALYLGAQA